MFPVPFFEKTQYWFPDYCVYYYSSDRSEGVLVSGIGRNWKRPILYRPDLNRWKFCNQTFPFTKAMEVAGTHHTSLNGIMYVTYFDRDDSNRVYPRWVMYDDERGPVRFFLCAYDIATGYPILGKGITLPEFKKYERPEMLGSGEYLCFVAVAGYKLCYLWTEREYGRNRTNVFRATVVVSPDRRSASVLEEQIELKVSEIQDCIPFDWNTDEN